VQAARKLLEKGKIFGDVARPYEMNFLSVSKVNFTGKMAIFQNLCGGFAPDLFAFWRFESNITEHVHVSSRNQSKAVKRSKTCQPKNLCAQKRKPDSKAGKKQTCPRRR
jgi:hypothetical protein